MMSYRVTSGINRPVAPWIALGLLRHPPPPASPPRPLVFKLPELLAVHAGWISYDATRLYLKVNEFIELVVDVRGCCGCTL